MENKIVNNQISIAKGQYNMKTKRFLLLFLALSLIISGCGGAPEKKTHTIGIIVEIPWLSPIVDNFKTTMTELGYVEGENVTYLYDLNVGPDQAAFDKEAARLMEENVDLFFTVGTMTTKAAKKATEGSDIPVVFTPVINPVEEGVVDSIARPGGNVTGVQIVDHSAKALEWALRIAPDTKHVYIPHNPDDTITMLIMKGVFEAIPSLGVELLPSEVKSVDEMLAAVSALPEDTIIFVVSPISSLETGVEQLGKEALKYGVPIFTCNREINTPPFPISNYTVTFSGEAKQGAQMVDRILKGAKPGDTPVETAEYFLDVDLKQAQAFGIQIPDEILNQANVIVR
ncbi:MAG: ABC transporter substrate-binding protein [Anaerolineales bacterium]|nr:ABC transporter substrate-binding protein [Anaerolineales bacterium]